jgi:hypothetical protein
MPYKTREERIEAQETDDGDPDEQVWVRRGTKVTHYHDSEECARQTTDNIRQVTLATA